MKWIKVGRHQIKNSVSCVHIDLLPGCRMSAVGSLADGNVMNIIGMFPNTCSLLREEYCSILLTLYIQTQKTVC